jgi:hypothetical protein
MSMTLEHLEVLGLPPLPEDAGPQRTAGASAKASRRAVERERAVAQAMQSLRGMKGALRTARRETRGATARERSAADAVTGLLKQYAPEELDRLLLDCDAEERRFLLGCLVK